MPHNPFGWDLPPGVTNADIDRHFGDPDEIECDVCAESFVPEDGEKTCPKCAELSPCCGVEFDPDTEICPQCKEHI